jgi:pilus assembly protein CpaF
MLQAMNTGHDGSISTIHSNSPRDAFSRLETMVLMAGLDLPSRAIREQIASAIDLVVHLQRMRDGSRVVTRLVEITGMEGDVVTASDIYSFEHHVGADGVDTGRIKPTGIRPVFTTRLKDAGFELPAELFGGLTDLPDLRARRR